MSSMGGWKLLLAALWLAACLAGSASVQAAKVLEVSTDALPRIIENHKKLLYVEFYSADCQHCRTLEPVLEQAADLLKDKVTFVKVDYKAAVHLNIRYNVTQTPTLLLFKSGQLLEHAREDLQGYRSASAIQTYLEMLLGPSVTALNSAAELEDLVSQHGIVITGVFPSKNSTGYGMFRDVAKTLRHHIKFAACADEAIAQKLAAEYMLDEVPTMFVAKKNNYAEEYDGKLTKRTELESWIQTNAFPHVGNLSMVTYYRYMGRNLPMMYLFYDVNQPADLEEPLAEFEKACALLDGEFSCVTVERQASEADGRLMLRNTGLSFFQLPAVSVRSADRGHSRAMNQLESLTQENILEFAREFLDKPDESRNQCTVSTTSRRQQEYTEEELQRYEEFALAEKTRLQFNDDEIREVDEVSFKKVLKTTQKDVLIVYTARWCAFAAQVEDTLHKLMRLEMFKDLIDEDELMVVKVDVVQTSVPDFHTLNTVPAMKYVSARFKDFPSWLPSTTLNATEVVELVRSYHSMRHLEIPGEGPSPFTVKKQEAQKQKQLMDAVIAEQLELE